MHINTIVMCELYTFYTDCIIFHSFALPASTSFQPIFHFSKIIDLLLGRQHKKSMWWKQKWKKNRNQRKTIRQNVFDSTSETDKTKKSVYITYNYWLKWCEMNLELQYCLQAEQNKTILCSDSIRNMDLLKIKDDNKEMWECENDKQMIFNTYTNDTARHSKY